MTAQHATELLAAAVATGEPQRIRIVLSNDAVIYRMATVTMGANGKFDLHFIGEGEPNVVS